MKRRDFINYSTLAGAGLVFDGLFERAAAQAAPGATVKTATGSVRGYLDNGVHVFKGVPYAASTAGTNRFMPPQKRQPWTGVREATQWGHRPPQILGGEPAEMLPTDPREALGEDCLVLNVWTPNPSAGRRPVMVWLHGGGFASGSGSYSIYEGRELARKHDVVSISVNHRLNALGFLYLAHHGGKWASASNVGMLDVVAALEWVRDNIAAFGGDPANVTIFGQSGGAGKVSTLMAMPAARGLFHRAIAQSGSALTAIPVEQAVKTTDQILQRLKIAPDRLDQLQTIPFAQIIDALRPVQGAAPLPGAGPVLDGKSLPVNPFDPTAPAQSASVPFLTGTTATEMTFFAPDDQLQPVDDATLRQRVKGLLKVEDADADRMIALYRKNQPGRDNIDLFLRMETDAGRFRLSVDTQAERKAAQRGAPVYLYRFEYYSPVRGGRLKAMHCMEIPFVFDNLEAGKVYTGVSPDAQRIADRMSAAWVAFARTGNPSHRGIPQWPAFNSTERPTMVFGNEAKMVNDPGREERLALKAIRDRQAKTV
ncbi:MAG TPA: carboxylesterase/lipase family protein [Vicinamibacterales bacterium]|nr:carboxylesterase/lipase family protein [Vicinamibacterales bacterium]